MKETSPSTMIPSGITLHKASRVLSLQYENGNKFDLPCEFLRVYTPSAEARGHGPGQEVLQVGKRDVSVDRIEPVGQYAICLVFSDGHDTGIYSWDLLYKFCLHYDELWANYLDAVERSGASRDPLAETGEPAGGCNGGACGR